MEKSCISFPKKLGCGASYNTVKVCPSIDASILQLKILCVLDSLPLSQTFHTLTISGHLICIQKFVVSPLVDHSPPAPSPQPKV